MSVLAFPADRTPEGQAGASDAAIVAMLEKLLDRARAGDIDALAVCIANHDGSTTQDWVNTYRCHHLGASISYLQVRYAISILSHKGEA